MQRPCQMSRVRVLDAVWSLYRAGGSAPVGLRAVKAAVDDGRPNLRHRVSCHLRRLRAAGLVRGEARRQRVWGAWRETYWEPTR
jgi:hypothetical protein